jgi:release factor glutamine methyltransferase
MNPLVAALRRLAYRIWYRRVQASLERADPCSLFGLDLLVAPRVLHPRHFISSQLLARQVLMLDLDGKTVADIGTGSGILGLLAARSGAMVTAVDLNPAAVACATGNAQRNGLADRVSTIESDVFERVPAEARFDFVITNPPFYPRKAESLPDHAFAAGVGNGFFAKLAESLPGRLAKGGALLMIQSSDTDCGPIGRMFEGRGMSGRVVSERRGCFETLTIREFRRRESPPAASAGS